MPSALMQSISVKPASTSASRLSLVSSSPASTIDFAGFRVDHVDGGVAADQVVIGDGNLLDAVFLPFAQTAHRHLRAGFHQHVARLGILPVADGFGVAHPGLFDRRGPAAALGVLENDLRIEIREDVFLRHAERIKKCRRRQLAAAVDADMHDVLGVEFEVEPRTAIGNDAGCEQQLARRMGLALVVVEEDARRTVHLARRSRARCR